MCKFIGIESLVANYLIDALRKNEKNRFVSYKYLEKYGAEVIKILEEKHKKVILILSRETTNDLIINYSEYFEEIDYNNELGIALKKDKSLSDLENKFIGNVSLDVLFAYRKSFSNMTIKLSS